MLLAQSKVAVNWRMGVVLGSEEKAEVILHTQSSERAKSTPDASSEAKDANLPNIPLRLLFRMCCATPPIAHLEAASEAPRNEPPGSIMYAKVCSYPPQINHIICPRAHGPFVLPRIGPFIR